MQPIALRTDLFYSYKYLRDYMFRNLGEEDIIREELTYDNIAQVASTYGVPVFTEMSHVTGQKHVMFLYKPDKIKYRKSDLIQGKAFLVIYSFTDFPVVTLVSRNWSMNVCPEWGTTFHEMDYKMDKVGYALFDTLDNFSICTDEGLDSGINIEKWTNPDNYKTSYVYCIEGNSRYIIAPNYIPDALRGLNYELINNVSESVIIPW